MTAASLLVAVTLAACAAGSREADGPPTEVPFEAVLDQPTSGLDRARREVVRDEAAWARLWAEIHANESPVPPPPPVDFARDMLIAVATGTRPTGGFDIGVRSVVLRGEALEVAVHETCPSPGDAVIMALTQPVEVVKLARFPQAPAFPETRSASCR